ncbi:MAG: hypothetical protein QF918_08485 [Pirellulaceae bacterium]|jgi:tetratricopeptide (TPR) repeat protein|nr:hypothetical protein [Pirellulaceae bacterium]MDP6553635.1 hypothetical protein [Pirellulaceae bacterium]
MDPIQFLQLYGQPGSWLASTSDTDYVVVGPTVENMLMAAEAIRRGKTVGIISGSATHRIAPHPVHDSMDHAKFFEAISTPVPTEHSDAELWSDRAEILYDLGLKLESLECCLRSLAIDAAIASPWVNAGRYFMDPEVRDLSLATACLTNALEIEPDGTVALENQAGVFFAQERFQDCIQYCERTLSIDAKSVFAHYYISFAIVKLAPSYAPAERLTYLRKALQHAKKCRKLARDRPDMLERIELGIRWLKDQISAA